MRKPQDPRNHGLKEPKEVISRTDRLYLADLDSAGKVSLESVIGAWNKAVKDHESQGHRITAGPHFDSGSYYGHSICLTYTYEWDNFNFSVEKAGYDLEMANYQAQLTTFHQVEEAVRKNPPDLDQKIERTKQRLANLEATKAGQPIPYPDM